MPGTLATAFSMAIAVFSICSRLSPKTSMPSGLRTPVDSISVRVWIGIQKMFGMPG